MIDLSILIPTHIRDIHNLTYLSAILNIQAENAGLNIEILTHIDSGILSTGDKSNKLMSIAHGKYLCRFDADDKPTDDYMRVMRDGIRSNADCISLRGMLYIDGVIDGIFEHSIKYNQYRTINAREGEVKYERFPNHLNAVKSSIAKQFTYPNKTISEDTEFATKMYNSGLIKTEHYDSRIIYLYQYRTVK